MGNRNNIQEREQSVVILDISSDLLV